MVFWVGGEKKVKVLVSINKAENVSFDFGSKNRKISKIIMGINSLGGLGALNHIAVSRKTHICIYKLDRMRPLAGVKVVKRLKIVSEGDDIFNMPDSVVTKSNDIEFIRGLMIHGKKVSWYNPDLNVNLNNMLLFDFEFLFLNCFLGYNIVHPDGRIIGIKIRSKNLDGYDFYVNKCHPPMYKKIGYMYRDYSVRFTYVFRKFLDWKYGWGSETKSVMARPLFMSLVHYYNFLSISYILWERSIATTVKKNANIG